MQCIGQAFDYGLCTLIVFVSNVTQFCMCINAKERLGKVNNCNRISVWAEIDSVQGTTNVFVMGLDLTLSELRSVSVSGEPVTAVLINAQINHTGRVFNWTTHTNHSEELTADNTGTNTLTRTENTHTHTRCNTFYQACIL